jgi:S-adenosylmethionine decarboxylase proenzyme
MEHQHLLYDLWLPDREMLKYVEPLRTILVDAAVRGRATIYHQYWHQFEPWGVTGFLLLKESHISIHTWPEEDNFAAVDIFPCGPMDVDLIVALLRAALHPVRERLVREARGGAGPPLLSPFPPPLPTKWGGEGVGGGEGPDG